jgi:3-dehydroquinate synthase
MTDSKPLKHGEAVAIGIICEAFLSFKTMKLDGDDFEKIIKVITSNFEKYFSSWNIDELLKIMQNDKKNNNSEINFTLLKKIGKPSNDCNCTNELIIESLDFYKNVAYKHKHL